MPRPLFLLAITALLAGAAPRPNILYFYVDDMGWGSIGPNAQAARKAAGKPYVLTPNLDRLAAEGINFARGYGATVCSPARSSQQTGFHQGHAFADRNDPDNAKKAMRADDITMGDALAAAGYATGYWGKWGYGGSRDMANPSIDNIQTLPTSHGYQHVVAELHHVRAHTFFQPTLWTAPAPDGAIGGLHLTPNSMKPYANTPKYPQHPANQGHPDYPETAYCDDVYAFAALDFVREQSQAYTATKQPFFALFAAQIPHAPFGEIQKLPAWDAAYADKPFFKNLPQQAQQWCAMVTRIDAHFGNILAALDDPNGDGDRSDSVADNTLVIFQSDNGGPGGSNNTALDANGGLRGTKGSIQEGGIRVPTIMRWPARITADSALKAGTTSNMVIGVTDLLPTFCELAGTAPPCGLDGVSIAPTLSGEGQQRQREYLIHEAGNGASIIKGKWKLVRGKAKTPKNKKGKKQPAAAPTLALQLFDLEADHGESTNIAAKHPELVAELEAKLLAERVTEPAGFANSHHRWTAGKGDMSDAANWSDYIYANAGITYITDDGAPQLSWTARIDQGSATLHKPIDLLSLEVGGSVEIRDKGVLNARNELRVTKGGTLQLRGGTAKSARWVDVQAGGTLSGSGTIDAALYSQGILQLAPKGLQVTGPATLSGELKLSDAPSGKRVSILKAAALTGRFANNEVVAEGKRYAIRYTPNTVTLVAR
jgi:arylsulfatase A-like enzyme